MKKWKGIVKRRHLPNISVLLTLIVILFCQDTSAQQKVFKGWSIITTDQVEVADLSKTVEEMCIASIKDKTEGTSVEVRFQSQFESEAKEILQALKQIVEKTQAVLQPLPVEGIRFYLLQMPNPPRNYKVLLPKQGEVFVLGKVFESKKQIEFNCITNWDFCNDIYVTLSHEITHPALNGIVDARWFEEGLANYAGFEVARQLSPLVVPYEREIAVKSSLHNSDFQQELFEWVDNKGAFWKSKVRLKRLKGNSQQETYDAAQQFFTAIIKESRKKGVASPVKILLESLQKFHVENGKAATTQDILALIKEKLDVDYRLVGALSKQERENLVEQASKSLLQSGTNNNGLKLQKRFYSIAVLMNLEEIALSDECLDFLLNLAFDEKGTILRRYPAMVLLQRVNQSNFDRSLQRFRQATSSIKKISLNNLKKELKKISLQTNTI